jgi:hypothetical protein
MWGWLKLIGGILKRAFAFAQEQGLSDDIIQAALKLVKEAAERFQDNTERREWVIAGLRAFGIPERIARLAVELAVVIWKKEG